MPIQLAAFLSKNQPHWCKLYQVILCPKINISIAIHPRVPPPFSRMKGFRVVSRRQRLMVPRRQRLLGSFLKNERIQNGSQEAEETGQLSQEWKDSEWFPGGYWAAFLRMKGFRVVPRRQRILGSFLKNERIQNGSQGAEVTGQLSQEWKDSEWFPWGRGYWAAS